METDIKLTQPQLDIVEDSIVAVLTNEPSEITPVGKYNVSLVFQRPTMIDKFKQRAWATKKLKEIGVADDEDQQISFFFRYWGTLNSYVKHVYVIDSKGELKFGGKKYSEYSFDIKTELDYKSVFEKYVMLEIVEKGLSEESFVSDVIMLHASWISDNAKVKEDDIKNS